MKVFETFREFQVFAKNKITELVDSFFKTCLLQVRLSLFQERSYKVT